AEPNGNGQARREWPAVLCPESERNSVDAGAWIAESLKEYIGAADDKVGQGRENIHAAIAIGQPAIEENAMCAGSETEQMAAACDLQTFDLLDVTLGTRLIKRGRLPECQDTGDVVFRTDGVGRDIGITLSVLHAQI